MLFYKVVFQLKVSLRGLKFKVLSGTLRSSPVLQLKKACFLDNYNTHNKENQAIIKEKLLRFLYSKLNVALYQKESLAQEDRSIRNCPQKISKKAKISNDLQSANLHDRSNKIALDDKQHCKMGKKLDQFHGRYAHKTARFWLE